MAGRHALTVVGDGTTSFHDLLEFLARAVETDLDGEQAHSQEVGNLGGGESMGLMQQDDSAIMIGQEVEAALHASAGFLPLDRLEHGGRRRHRRRQLAGGLIGLYSRMTFALAQTIEGGVGGDAIQPTANGIAISQRVTSTMSAQKRLLGQIFGLGGISYEAEEVAIDSIVVSLEEQACVNGIGCRCHSVIFSRQCGEIHDPCHRSL